MNLLKNSFKYSLYIFSLALFFSANSVLAMEASKTGTPPISPKEERKRKRTTHRARLNLDQEETSPNESEEEQEEGDNPEEPKKEGLASKQSNKEKGKELDHEDTLSEDEDKEEGSKSRLSSFFSGNKKILTFGTISALTIIGAIIFYKLNQEKNK